MRKPLGGHLVNLFTRISSNRAPDPCRASGLIGSIACGACRMLLSASPTDRPSRCGCPPPVASPTVELVSTRLFGSATWRSGTSTCPWNRPRVRCGSFAAPSWRCSAGRWQRRRFPSRRGHRQRVGCGPSGGSTWCRRSSGHPVGVGRPDQRASHPSVRAAGRCRSEAEGPHRFDPPGASRRIDVTSLADPPE
mgnify:CR=1 FL=1